MFSELKWAYQRVVKGYDDRIFWELDSYFEQFIPAIKEFCEDRLKDEFITLNPNRKDVFETTLRLIEEHKNAPTEDFYKNPNTTTVLWEYIGKNITIYWD